MISVWLEIATRKMGEPTIATPILGYNGGGYEISCGL